ncbi:IclR family transcriptional regulator [Paenibacillus periandrae]|uniref:IclR family transcriptional regulator n=1 Tax=Paenibacillus periandrae TaxID=1761741 RepID=UPI001F09CCEC
MDSYELTTLKKGLLILDILRMQHTLTMSQIMQELNLTKSTAYKMLFTLEKMNYIRKLGKFYYLNTIIFKDNKGNSNDGIQWTSLVTPYRLANYIGEIVFVSVLDHNELITTNVIKEPDGGPVINAINKRTPIHSSAMGKVILAHLPLQKQQEILKNLLLEIFTENSFNDKDLFNYHLNMIKAQGYAVDNEETIIGKRCIAAPIHIDGKVIGSLAIHGDVERITKNKIRSFGRKVIRFSKQLSVEIECSRS